MQNIRITYFTVYKSLNKIKSLFSANNLHITPTAALNWEYIFMKHKNNNLEEVFRITSLL